jgi:hypothetical protein
MKLDIVLKWLATGMLIAGAALTSGSWLYPINVVLFLLGNLFWAWVGIIWKEYSLIVLNVVITIIYVIGLTIKYWSAYATNS